MVLTFHDGVPVASSKGIRLVIEDMRRVVATDGFKLDMGAFAYIEEPGGPCLVCAGGAAVIFGSDGCLPTRCFESAYTGKWASSQKAVAEFFNNIRIGNFEGLRHEGFTVPYLAVKAYSLVMIRASDPEFFPAWERFADAWEAAEKEAASA